MWHKSGSPVHYRGGSLGWATRCVVLWGAMHQGVAVAVAGAVAGCNLHQTKRRQSWSCPGWEVDEPCLPRTHIPQLFLLIIIIAVFVEDLPKALQVKNKAPHFSLLPSHIITYCYEKKIKLISRDLERKFWLNAVHLMRLSQCLLPASPVMAWVEV